MNYEIIETGGVPVRAWIKGVPFEEGVRQQVSNVALLPFVKGIALMADCHVGIGSTVGSVVVTHKAIVPSICGVDLSCGCVAMRTSLTSHDLPTDLKPLREAFEHTVPVGFNMHDRVPSLVETKWRTMDVGYEWLKEKYPQILNDKNPVKQLGTLGGGNHFIELCIDEEDRVWLMLHSGSRGIGNKIGTFFIARAREELEKHGEVLPDKDLAYFTEGTNSFDDYMYAVNWAQNYAAENRAIMMQRLLSVMREDRFKMPVFTLDKEAINIHHNYISTEVHFGESNYVTRKGAVNASKGTMGLIPSAMGQPSYVVRGLGNPDSFNSSSHGAGRIMSRTKAKKNITLEQHVADTAGVECRKDSGMLDESPGAYKPIDLVMAAQSDLIEVVHKIKAILCVKG
jgi:tRNA-splicing ligase RtcB